MIRLVIDTDAGVDDAQAIMLALAHSNAQVEAITTVTGNIHVDKVIPNVFSTLSIMQKDAPVFRGAARPLIARWHPEEAFHGEDGLGDMPNRQLPTRAPQSDHAAIALVHLANRFPGELTLAALGPMTNIALALRLDPTLPQKIKQLIWMGGTIRAQGNTPMVTAEWNIYSDPEAAHIVLDAFPMSTMLSWETTLDFPFTWEQFDALCRINSQRGRFYRDISLKTSEFLRRLQPNFGYLLPDPLAIALTIEPEIISQANTYFVTVELNGAHTRGQTVIDYGQQLRREPNVRVVTSLSIQRVYEMFEQTLME